MPCVVGEIKYLLQTNLDTLPPQKTLPTINIEIRDTDMFFVFVSQDQIRYTIKAQKR